LAPDVPWRMWDVLAVALIVLLAEGTVLPLLPGNTPGDSIGTPLPVVSNLLLLVVTLGWVALVRGRGAVRRVFGPPVQAPKFMPTVGFGIAIGLLWPVFDTALYGLFEWLAGPIPAVQEDLQSWVAESSVKAWWALDVAGITPIAEEVFFRGLLFAALARRWHWGWAAALSSLVFGLAHIESGGLDSVFIVLSTACFGFALCWLFQRCRSLWGPIAAHVVANGLATVALLGS